MNHPNLQKNYFNIIDTKDKAYWLGFLYADGCVEKNNNRIDITLNEKDECIIDHFIKCLRLNIKKKEHVRENQIRIRVVNKEIRDGLIKHGCIPRKSLIIELPNLNGRELYLAFLLGYYDGDGSQGLTKISSGSEKFLIQIREMFHILNPVHKEKSYCWLSIGTTIFNEMMITYNNSLPRKRKHFCTVKERIDNAKKNYWNGFKGRKLNISKDELEKLVWKIPSEQIAKKYGVSGSLISKQCKKFGIDKPKRGYWSKH